jgi:hypothetical protein
MECRPNCAACCIIPSISSLNKPAFEPCQHLTDDLRCSIFGKPERPKACAAFAPEPDFCGDNREQAIQILTLVEESTR